MKSLLKCVLVFLFMILSNSAFSECSWPNGQAVCDFYLSDYCSINLNTGYCENDDCFGKNRGEEIVVTPGGVWPFLWIAKTDGLFFEFGVYRCDVRSFRGTSLLELPVFEDGHTGCVAGLKTQDHSYFEFFANNPDGACMGWVECLCD